MPARLSIPAGWFSEKYLTESCDVCIMGRNNTFFGYVWGGWGAIYTLDLLWEYCMQGRELDRLRDIQEQALSQHVELDQLALGDLGQEAEEFFKRLSNIAHKARTLANSERSSEADSSELDGPNTLPHHAATNSTNSLTPFSSAPTFGDLKMDHTVIAAGSIPSDSFQYQSERDTLGWGRDSSAEERITVEMQGIEGAELGQSEVLPEGAGHAGACWGMLGHAGACW